MKILHVKGVPTNKKINYLLKKIIYKWNNFMIRCDNDGFL